MLNFKPLQWRNPFEQWKEIWYVDTILGGITVCKPEDEERFCTGDHHFNCSDVERGKQIAEKWYQNIIKQAFIEE